ncbi:MAG: choice-of-anchor V domain-containing protein, partial [Candidatus Thermoplasmatota archaeon]
GPAGTTGGVNLKATAGTLIAGPNNKLEAGELTHSNSSSRSWSFNWRAPATEGAVNLYAASQACNGSGTGGDSWNWYGGAVNTPFPITVSSTVGVEDDDAPALSLGPAYPNPFLGSARFDFSLAEAGSARMEVFDLSGRRVATIVSGILTAGRHTARWDGRDEGGRAVGAGVYLVRLTAGGRTLSARVIRAS